MSRLLAALLAPAGVVVAHALAYSAAHGWEHDRQATLTGYGPLAMLASVALPLAFLALVLVLAATPGSARPRLRQQVTLQIAVFAGVEFLEHVVAVEPLVSAVHDPAVWFGVAAQLVTATLLLLLVRGADRLRSRWSPPREPGRVTGSGGVWHPGMVEPVVARAFLSSTPRRGPPAVAVVRVRS